MNKNKKKYKSGFSIIEVIIYLAIFTVLSILVINSFIIILSSYKTSNTNRNLMEGGLNVMERLSREIRNAENINLTNTTSNNLELEYSNDLGEIIITKIIFENGDLNLYQANILKGNLLTNNLELINLGYRIISTPEGQAVKIEMTLEENSGRTPKSENFYNTIILRGAY
jgi:type II secretory pathway component PulJ